MELDAMDRKILTELVLDSRIKMTELARRVGLSKTPVSLRVQQLEKSGVISGYRTLLSAAKLGQDHVTFVEVRLSDTREAALTKFNQAVQIVPEVEECYMIAGGFDYLIKVRSANIADYRRVMAEVISNLPFVSSTSSYVAMEAVVENSPVKI